MREWKQRRRIFVLLGSAAVAVVLGFAIKPLIHLGVNLTEHLNSRPVLNFSLSYALLAVLVWSLWNGFSTPVHRFYFRNALVTYALFSFGMSGIYYLVYKHGHDCFQFRTGLQSPPGIFDFIYFSFVTITTVGYGDIVPRHSFVRGVVLFQVLIGLALLLKLSHCHLNQTPKE